MAMTGNLPRHGVVTCPRLRSIPRAWQRLPKPTRTWVAATEGRPRVTTMWPSGSR